MDSHSLWQKKSCVLEDKQKNAQNTAFATLPSKDKDLEPYQIFANRCFWPLLIFSAGWSAYCHSGTSSTAQTVVLPPGANETYSGDTMILQQ